LLETLMSIQHGICYLVRTIWFHYFCGLCTMVHESFWVLFDLCILVLFCISPVYCVVCSLCGWRCLLFCVLLGFWLCVRSLNWVAQFFIPCEEWFGHICFLILGFVFVLWIVVSCLSRRAFTLLYIL
jgi:hypothetical protein